MTKVKLIVPVWVFRASLVAQLVKNLLANAGDSWIHRFDPWDGKILWNGSPLPYSCLEDFMNRGAKWVAKIWT